MADSYWLIAVAAISTLISILTLTVALDGFGVRFATDFDETKPLSPDAIYLGGATIIGLATFGSALAIRIKMERTARGKSRQQVRIGLLLGGALALIISQWVLMLGACCLEDDLDLFFYFHAMTLISAVLVIVSFGSLLDRMFSSSSKPQKPK